MVKLRKGDWVQIITTHRTDVALVSQTRYRQNRVWIWFYDPVTDRMRNQYLQPNNMATKITAGTVTVTKLPKAVAKIMRPYQWDDTREYL